MKCCFGVSHSHCDPCCLNTKPPVPPSPACSSFTEPQRAFQPFTSPGDSLFPCLPLTPSFALCVFLLLCFHLMDWFSKEQHTTQQQRSVPASTDRISTLNRTMTDEERKHKTHTVKLWYGKTLSFYFLIYLWKKCWLMKIFTYAKFKNVFFRLNKCILLGWSVGFCLE